MGTVTNITTIYEHFSEYSDAICVVPSSSSSYQKFGNFWEGGNKHLLFNVKMNLKLSTISIDK